MSVIDNTGMIELVLDDVDELVCSVNCVLDSVSDIDVELSSQLISHESIIFSRSHIILRQEVR